MACLALLGCVACGGADYGDPPGTSGSQITFLMSTQRAEPDLVVAVVDDTQLGAPLRDQFLVAIEGHDAEVAARASSCLAPNDPAAWHPVDHSVVIVHPSAVGDARFSSSANDPALRWREADQSTEGRTRWLAAVRSALATPLARPDAPFQALAAFHDSFTLLHGIRQPATPGEQSLLAALPESAPYPFIGVVVGKEDESPGEASQYTTDDPDTLIVPAATPEPARDCSQQGGTATPRYEGWGFFRELWPCTKPDVFPALSDDCTKQCLPRPIATDEAGGATCVATATYLGTEACPADFGWLDPMGTNGVRAPRVEHGASGDMRVCEVRQLAGAALASCRNQLACTDCEPGWCATEVPELVPTDRYCAPGTHYPPFRFVLGAGTGPESIPGALFSVVCDGAPAQ